MEETIVGIQSILNSSKILKPNFHLNYGKRRIETAKTNKKPFTYLGDLVLEVYTGGIFKRIFVEKEESGIPYISAQHMMSINPLEVAKTISKRYTPRQNDMTLRDEQILVSCAGTVGNTRLIGKDLDGIIGSQDIIRIIGSDDKCPYGFIYAYLATPTAYNYIQSFIYGSVVPRIGPDTLAKLPVPKLDKEIIYNCHNNIVESKNKREKAVLFLKEAIDLIENEIPEFDVDKISTLNIKKINNYRKRLESSLNINSFDRFYQTIDDRGIPIKTISELSEEVFTPNIFKRNKVDKTSKSTAYIGGAELLNLRPKINSYLASTTKNLDSYILKRRFIAIQDSGSIQSMGYVSLIPNYLNGVAATNNLVRIVPKQKNDFNNYIFAFLKTKQANQMLKRMAYGTGQLHLDNKLIEDFKVPILDEKVAKISELIDNYLNLLEVAFELEKTSINLIEKEIEEWQK
jgi:type I restriction enzyme S subunit